MPNKVVYGQMPEAKPAVQGLLEGFESQMQQAMQQSAQMKMLDWQRRLNEQYAAKEAARVAQGAQIYGMPPEKAEALKYLNPALQQQAFKEYLQEPGTRALANFGNKLLAPQQQEGGMPNGQQQNQPQDIFEGMRRNDIEKVLPMLLQQQSQIRSEEGKDRRQDKLLAAQAAMRQEGASEKEIAAKSAELEKDQAHIEKQNAPLINYLTEASRTAKEGLDIAVQMKKDLDTGKVSTNVSKYVYEHTPNLPGLRYSTETQNFDTNGDKLAILESAALKGNPSNARIQYVKGTKPTIFKSSETAYEQLNDYIEKFSRVLLESAIKDNEIAKNDGEQPKNLNKLVSDRINYIYQKGIPFHKAYEEFQQRNAKQFEEAQASGMQQPQQNQLPPEQAVVQRVAKNPPGYEGPGNLKAATMMYGPEGAKGQQYSAMGEQIEKDLKERLSQVPQTDPYGPEGFKGQQLPFAGKKEEDLADKIARAPLSQIMKSTVGLGTDLLNNIIFAPFDALGMALNIGNIAAGGFIPNAEEVGLPSSESAKDWLANKTGGFTAPSTPGEAAFRNALGTIEQLLFPPTLVSKGAKLLSNVMPAEKALTAMKFMYPFAGTKMSPKEAAILGFGGSAAREYAKASGAGHIGQGFAEALATITLGIRGTRPYWTDKMKYHYGKAAESIAKHPTISIKSLMEGLEKLKGEVGTSAGPYKEESLKLIHEFETGIEAARNAQADKTGSKILSNSVPVENVLQWKRNTNEWNLLNRIPQFEGQQYLTTAGRRTAERINGLTQDLLGDYGKRNLRFKAHFDAAEDIFKGLNNMSDFTRNIQHVNMANAVKNLETKGIWGFGHVAAAGAVKPIKDMALMYSFLKSPVGRKAYVKAFKAVAKNDASSFAHNAAIVDKVVKKESQETEEQKKKVSDVIARIV